MYDKRSEQDIRTQEIYLRKVLTPTHHPRVSKKSFEVIINFEEDTYELSNLTRD